ncbi:MAG: aliphatic sulfonate ABC transporter substrate-binding protein [Lachnospiraceae bacterium]|nr:aliphatic sulfonate ABC transporter substrate-binding protein [Lachnospiraceae bacterium]
MKRRLGCLFATLLLLLGLTTGCGIQGGGMAGKVRIAIQPSAAFVPLFVAKEKGWIEEALREKGLSVEWVDFVSGPPMNDALLNKDVDLGVIGDVPVVTVCAPGNEVEVVSIAAQAADSYAVLVPDGSGATDAADLAGKRVATTFGSTGHNMVQKFLATAGLTINDIQLVNIAAGDAETVLASNQADAVSIWEPNVTRLCDDIGARIIGEGSDCGLAGINAIVARSEYAKAHPEVVTTILEQYKRAAEDLGTMDEATLDAVAKDLSIQPDQLQRIIPKFRYTVEITDEDLAALNDTIRFLNENKIMRTKYDIAESTDSSYYDAISEN